MTATQAAERLQIPVKRFNWIAGRLKLGQPIPAVDRRSGKTVIKYRAPKDYSNDDVRKVRALTDGLIDIDDASRCLELSKTQIRFYAEKLGIKKRPPFMHFWFTADEVEQIRVAHEEGHARQQFGNRRRQHDALLNDRDARDYYGKLRAFNIVKTEVYLGEIDCGPGVPTLQWHPFYVPASLDPDDSDTSKWGNVNENRKWISFEDLQQWHPDFMKDRY